MLDKLKKAAVLFVIAAMSGLLIWGTHAITEEAINLNRERARLQVYVDMFPELDVDKIETLEIEHSAVIEQLTFYHQETGALLGYAFRGNDNNAFDFIEVVVGIDTNGQIVGVAITSTENTPTYVNIIVSDYLPKLVGQSISNISYDANTGATQTYDSVKIIIEAAIILVAGDPILEAYQILFASASRYEDSFNFFLGSVRKEVSIIDANDDVIGHVYEGMMTYEDDDYTIGIAVDINDRFLGFIPLEEDLPSTISDAFTAFDEYLDQSIDDINIDVSGDIEDTLQALLELAFIRATETEDERESREYFLDAASIDDEVDVSHTQENVGDRNLEVTITHERAVRDTEHNIIGYVYQGEVQGHNGMITLDVAINPDGSIASVKPIQHVESAGYFRIVVRNFHLYVDLEDASDYPDDVYSGASVSGDAILAIVILAQEYHNDERGDE